ncbi:glycosyltransferase family 4 protein [Pseudomarimonas salicorniae]|uniref:Glycosyltransferase family 4 protein n=1 Tax=Pseudomarimonas salicorniae TaxID=2933270 RepID=A0ABT0GHH3_9GAMM|nr:glycosyltransferase family 4 protein [Lysobacter sp. CAU 1642]MCK7593988.1 glycosyltransferase family 4 protein [Lysobacter sp. CAU 1642]
MIPAPQRVLYVVSLFPCWSETFIVREIEQLIARGVEVRILSLRPPSEAFVQARAAALMPRVIGPRGWLREALPALGSVLRHPLGTLAVLAHLVRGMWRQPLPLAKSLVGLWRTLALLPEVRRFDPQWIHAHWATYPSTAAWMLGRLMLRPFSFTAHAHDIFVEDQLLARKLASARLAVTISRFNVRHLARWRDENAAPLEVVHCGVDLSELPLRLDDRAPQALGTVGRLDPIKGFPVLIEALRRLREQGIAFECELIGEGPQRAALEAQRREAGLDTSLAMPGAQPQERVREMLSRVAIFVMPSVLTPEGNQDGIPVALMEAMASGAAVIGTTVSGLPELITHEVDGLLVPPDNAGALAEAIARLLGDPALRRRLGEAARRRIEREFDAGIEAGRLLDHFRAVLAQEHA